MSWRHEKVNELIKEELGKIFLKNLEFYSGSLVTIIEAKVSVDCQHVRVFVSVFPEKETENMMEYLNRNIYEVQKILDKRLCMRPVPKIRFVSDKQGENFSRINQLLNKS